MVEHPVEYGDAVTEIGLEERHERPAVPRRERRHAVRARVVAPDAVLVEARPIFFLVKVIGLSQLGEEPAPVGRERTAGA